MKYAFVKEHAQQYPVRRLCKVMQVHPSGYYAWLREPHSARAQDDERLSMLLKQAWLECGGVYGYRKLLLDMRDLGERCGKHRGGKPAVVADNHLQRQFKVQQPNQAWVTDITYIRTHEGWLYLATYVAWWTPSWLATSLGSR